MKFSACLRTNSRAQNDEGLAHELLACTTAKGPAGSQLRRLPKRQFPTFGELQLQLRAADVSFGRI